MMILLALVVLAAGCGRNAAQSRQRAVQAWDSGNYKLAAEEYERYLAAEPDSEGADEARFELANIYYFKLRRFEQARAHYASFLNGNSSHENAQLARERLSEVLAELGRIYDAIAEYENLSPQDSNERRRIRLRIADLYFAQKNYSQALTEYEKVTEGASYDELAEQAYLRKASIYHIERSQFQQALPVYQQLITQSGDYEVRLRATYGLADCYAGLYRFEDAINTLRAIEDESEQKHIAEKIAELEAQGREADRAKSTLEP